MALEKNSHHRESDDWETTASIGINALYFEPELSDFTIASETGKEWKVHRVVFLIWSDVLYRMSTAKEFAECQNARATIKGFSDRAIEGMLHYMYKGSEYGSYYDGLVQEVEGVDIPALTVALLQLADMYNVRNMKGEFLGEFGGWLAVGSYNIPEEVDEIVKRVREVCQLPEIPDELWKVLVKDLTHSLTSKRWPADEIRKLFGVNQKLAADIGLGLAVAGYRKK